MRIFLKNGSQPEKPAPEAPCREPEAFSMAKLFAAWAKIGFTSFGGGATTQYLIQEEFIDKKRWITEGEYSTIVGMGQLAPGINILSYTILIGKKLGGWRGIFVSLMGLILPSAAVTVALTALYTQISRFQKTHSVLRVVFAAVLGITLATNWRNVRPIVAKNRGRGGAALAVTAAIPVASGILYLIFHFSVILLYVLGGFGGAAFEWVLSKRKAGN